MSEKANSIATIDGKGAAGRLSRAYAPLLQRECSCAPGKPKCDACEKDKKKDSALQRSARSGGGPVSAPASVNSVLSTPGRPLDAPTRSFMEPRFGHDFGGVRVHDDAAGAESARAVNANAYTVGQHIVFDDGKYNPSSHAGKTLLAHELAHTVQQSGLQRSSNDVSLDRGHEYDRLEREASHTANAVMAGNAVTLSRGSQAMVSRADKSDDGKVTRAPSKKPKSKQSTLGAHQVTPSEAFESEEGRIEEFGIDVFYLPGAKGPNAVDDYEAIAGGKLETTLELTGSGKTKTALWQKREKTEELRSRWLEKVGWPESAADELWKAAGGAKEFPKLKKGTTCQMDHIVELQLGGDNTAQNIQPLDAGPNQSSGGAIKAQLESLATAIASDGALTTGDPNQVKLRFGSVKVKGALEKLPSSCPSKEPTCLGVEKCAAGVKVEKTKDGKVELARDDYEISAGGGAPRNLRVPNTFAKTSDETVPIKGDSQNDSTSTLIPGLLLTELRHKVKGKTSPDIIIAAIDDRTETRLPISLDRTGHPVTLDVDKDHTLKLSAASKTTALAFTYKYLSPGTITSISLNDKGGVDWKGHINTSVPFLGNLGVEYKDGKLLVVKGLDPDELKKHSVLGLRVTKAQVQLELSPFKPEGVIELQVGSGEDPIAKAQLSLTADSEGIVAQGKLNVHIPKMKSAESEITYKGGGNRQEWKADIHIKSDDINLGPSVTVTGGFDAQITAAGINFDGKVDVTFPGKNTAQLGLKKHGNNWLLSGGGTFHFPRLDPTAVHVDYDLTDDLLIAEGKTGIHFEKLGISGELEHVKFVIAHGHEPRVSGKGKITVKKGKADGHVDVELHESGKISGKGSLSYKLKDNLVVTGTVELDENEKLRVTGELLVTRYEIFKEYGDKKDLFKIDLPVPVPGFSIGKAGLVFHIRGGVGVAYSFGPGAIEPLKFSAGFDPLESDPNLELTVTGSVKIPAKATLSAFIEGALSIEVDILVGSAGVEGGLRLTGDLILSAGAFADFTAAYKNKRLSAKLNAGIKTELLLGITLTAFAHAWAGAFGLGVDYRKDWTLAHKQVDTGLGFSLSAPFEYADDTGVKLPELKDVDLQKPDISVENMKHVLGQLFGSATETKKEE